MMGESVIQPQPALSTHEIQIDSCDGFQTCRWPGGWRPVSWHATLGAGNAELAGSFRAATMKPLAAGGRAVLSELARSRPGCRW